MSRTTSTDRDEPLVVHLRKDFVQLLAPTKELATARLKQLALIELFRRGEVSSGYAAKVLGMTKPEFIDLLAEHEVPYIAWYIDALEEELRQDLEVARLRWTVRKNSPKLTASRGSPPSSSAEPSLL
jgi:predicted HTH domain antitoxin